MGIQNPGSHCSICYTALWYTFLWHGYICVTAWCSWYVLNIAAEMEWIIIDTLGLEVLACLLFLLTSFSLFFLFLRRRLMLLWKKNNKTLWTWPSLFALNYAWNHHNCKYQSMPTEKCKAREVMALGKYTFSHMMTMITVCAFCMHSWLNVVMLAFTAEFSAVLYSKIILFFFLLELS